MSDRKLLNCDCSNCSKLNAIINAVFTMVDDIYETYVVNPMAMVNEFMVKATKEVVDDLMNMNITHNCNNEDCQICSEICNSCNNKFPRSHLYFEECEYCDNEHYYCKDLQSCIARQEDNQGFDYFPCDGGS